MNYQVQESLLSKLSARLNLMVVLVLGLMVSNIMLVYWALHVSAHQKREIVPFGLNSGYVLSDSSVDTHYLNLMSENFIYSRLNVTPANVSQHHGVLLDYVDSSLYGALKKQLLKEEALIKDKKISSTFDIIDRHSNAEQLTTLIKGNLKRLVGYRELKQEEKTYRIQYRYQLGKLTITSFAEDKGETHA